MEFFATAAKGTEGALRDELRELRFRGVRADRGGVHFFGDMDEGFRACIWLRTALRVLCKLSEFDAFDGETLYEGVRAIDWTPFLSPKHTLAVRSACRSSRLTHTQFIAQKSKDAIVDQCRERWGSRPSVNLDNPDVMLFVHLADDRATVYLDYAGEALHRRGYRTSAGEAPLKETLAAAIIRLSGWDLKMPLCDPMCGAGTIAIEAALWAYRVAPGLLRGTRFGFEKWACHDDAAAKKTADLCRSAKASILKEGPEIWGFDADMDAILKARENAKRAGVSIRFDRKELQEFLPRSEPMMIVTNPPYGQRLEASDSLGRELSQALSACARGSKAAILSGAPDFERSFPWRLSKAPLVVYNGAIACQLLRYE